MSPSAPDPQSFQVPFTCTAPYFDGVYLAVGVIPDAYLVYQAHNCGYSKEARISSMLPTEAAIFSATAGLSPVSITMWI